MKCKQCNQPFDGRADAQYCSAKCRVAAKRNKYVVTDNSVTDNVTDNLERCRTCNERLPALEKPRKYPGMCINCVTNKYSLKQPRVSQEIACE